MIIVTPHLVKPLDMAKQTLPTDGFKEPSAYEFFVSGELEGKAAHTQKLKQPQARIAPQAPAQGLAQDLEGKPSGFDGRFGSALPAGE